MKGKVLIVDDNPDILDVLETKLSDKYEIITTTNPKEALELKKKHGTKVIITDLKMPEIDGIEFCRLVRENDQISFVMALTGESQLYELVKCRQVGFDDYLTKPFKDEELYRLLDHAFNCVERWKTLIVR